MTILTKGTNHVVVSRLISCARVCVSESAQQFVRGRQPATEARMDSTRI